MKVILDANIYISYLLSRDQQRTIANVVETCFGQEIDLKVPQELFADLRDGVEESKYLKKHISPAELETLITVLTTSGEVLPPSESASISRDKDDDYLIVQGVLHNVDYIVTGDEDLLTLGHVEGVTMITPAQFLQRIKNKNVQTKEKS